MRFSASARSPQGRWIAALPTSWPRGSDRRSSGKKIKEGAEKIEPQLVSGCTRPESWRHRHRRNHDRSHVTSQRNKARSHRLGATCSIHSCRADTRAAGTSSRKSSPARIRVDRGIQRSVTHKSRHYRTRRTSTIWRALDKRSASSTDNSGSRRPAGIRLNKHCSLPAGGLQRIHRLAGCCQVAAVPARPRRLCPSAVTAAMLPVTSATRAWSGLVVQVVDVEAVSAACAELKIPARLGLVGPNEARWSPTGCGR
jgi:hypothetical protein